MSCSTREVGRRSSQSSSRLSGTPTPDEQVIEIVEKYKEVKSLSPVFNRPLKKPEQISLFLQILERHLSLIKSRSQAFEDGHITVYDKALLSLTHNGSDLYNAGALELYLDEVVGIRRGDSLEQMEDVLEKHMQMNALLSQAYDAETKKGDRARGTHLPALAKGDSKVNIQRPRQPRGLTLTEDKLSHILAVYAKAKADYYVIDESNVEDKARAAKFLRDTAENTLVYIKAQKADHRLIPELESTRGMAKDKAIALCGGRKRRFEICEIGNSYGVPRNPKRVDTKKHYRSNGEPYSSRSRDFYHRGSSYVGGGRRQADCYRPNASETKGK